MTRTHVALAEVRQRMAQAALRAGRAPDSVRLVAVSKTRPVAVITEALAAGQLDFGENYVQELVHKHQELVPGHQELVEPPEPLRWHFIGHLQRNKVRFIAPFCHLVHAVDSVPLGEEINRRAGECGRCLPVLLEVNLAGEATKFGLSPGEVAGVAQQLAGLPSLALTGLMAMTPLGASHDEARRLYGMARELAERLAADLPPGACRELSMGMTQDFEAAIEQGATLVRVGTAIFGSRSEA
jgi:PLP dependent protein